ncbi:MAG TPA: MBL fold metallo-hydrolase [Actinomycetes bacterium]|nr:MBL fold metallo-hydrolase [Actinomycetes bacterium]
MIEPVAGAKPQRARCVRADNPGALTLDGTNTWVLAELGASRCVVVDPGPDDATHVEAVLGAIDSWQLQVALVVVTHGHPDHSGAVDALFAATGAPVRAFDPAWCRGTVPLAHDERLEVDGLTLQVIATPGHTADSLSLLSPVDGALVTGDTVLGRGSALVAWPDGQLGDYLDSLQELRRLAAAGLVLELLPGHGPQVSNALRALDNLLAHREQRLDQVRGVLDAGGTSVDAIVDAVYGLPGPALRDAVVDQVKAQLEYLAGRGETRAGVALQQSRRT